MASADATPASAGLERPAPSSRTRIALVIVIVAGIVGGAWLLGEQQDFGSIGEGGVHANPIPSVGEQAPQLLTFTADGMPIRLSDLRGYPVWLNFWGSWCPPCRTEMPEVQAAYETLKPQGLIMLGISMQEEPATAVEYAQRAGATFPILADPNYLSALVPPGEFPEVREMVETWQINNFPTHIFIDRDGTIRAAVLNQMDYETAVRYGEMILDSPMPADVSPALVGTPSD
ncbi:MAG TPA: TlpA disulfide reductase family protein [Thermomicrobiales bacterium]|nr:TlpA disulfide reductase family protein [Thermomicrobiales bacterium]